MRRRSSSAAASSARRPPASSPRAGTGRAPARGGPLRRAVDGQVGGDRPLPLLEPGGRADGRALARDAPAAAAPARVRPGLHAMRLAVPRRRGERGVRARERRDAGRGGARHLEVAGPPASSCPGVDEAGIAYALHEPDAGFAEPVATTNAYIAALRAVGGRALEGTPVERVEVEGDRVRGVHVGGRARRMRQRRPRRRALDAEAGRGRRARAAARDHPRAGRDLRDRPGADDPDGGLVADRPGLPAARARARRVAPARRPGVPEGVRAGRRGRRSTRRSTRRSSRTSTSGSTGRLPRLAGHAPGRRPRRPLRRHARTGTRSSAPVDGLDGLFLATGGSGHCFKLGPAIGELVAGAVLGLKTGVRRRRATSRSRASPRGASSARPTAATGA